MSKRRKKLIVKCPICKKEVVKMAVGFFCPFCNKNVNVQKTTL